LNDLVGLDAFECLEGLDESAAEEVDEEEAAVNATRVRKLKQTMVEKCMFDNIIECSPALGGGDSRWYCEIG
jgi:hypothetical protein